MSKDEIDNQVVCPTCGATGKVAEIGNVIIYYDDVAREDKTVVICMNCYKKKLVEDITELNEPA